MDDHNRDHINNTHNSGSAYDRDTAVPIRSRWTPKPEQILILESIFNSGMVNPPKEETVRIRKLLERSNFIGDDSDDLFAISRQMGYMESKSQVPTYMCSTPEVSQLQYQPGTITVFINGLPTEVPSGLIDMRALFEEHAVLVNTSGELLPINEYGILMQSLQMGESYFLVSRPT
uniref:WUSCHEL-related homeobox 11-like n=1 Tax=Ananas comosus var. bracteatus TaxID=296719 RepID=A0A6V7PQQ4_ANACO|nr:unnamed protein product [Ananas comosus var. bracteatus]